MPETISREAELELIDAIRRATAAVLNETAALRAGGIIDFGAHRQEKERCLLDLSRRARSSVGLGEGPRRILHDLREAIIENQSVLKLHLGAARQVSDILLRVIADEESDKTYSGPQSWRGRRA